MTTELYRVVVVSREPVPVTTVLRFKLPGCLPVAVPSVEDVAQQLRSEAIVLIDLGEEGANLAAARRLRRQGIRHGIVVIGSSSTAGLSGVTGLQPPFRLEDLDVAMQRAREVSAGAAKTREERPAFTRTAEDAAQPPEAPAAALEGPPSPQSVASTTEVDGPPAPAPAETDPDKGDAAAQHGPEHDPVEPPAAPAPVRRGPSRGVPEVALDAVTSVDESLFSSKAPAKPGAQSDGGTPGEPLRSKVDRWRKRLTAPISEEPAGAGQRELYERLVRIFAATSQIESIATELPLITDTSALYQAIVLEVADEFAADSVALWRSEEAGWVAAAHVGLTGHQAGLPIALDQPVLSDLDSQAGAILLEPTISFQGLLRGIGGAHRESFMASAITIGSHRLGILSVGRDEPLVEADLDRLVEMAAEAAVGIGVAEHIERMSTLGEQTGGEGSGPEHEPGEWRAAFLDELKSASHARQHDIEAEDPGSAPGVWSAIATPDEQEPDQHGQPGGVADEADTVIDLTSRETKRA